MLRLEPSDSRPIWRQIEEGFAHLVACGALSAGGPVPRCASWPARLAVNPATVAKAYQRLADRGIFAVRRGEGTFVADATAAPRGARTAQQASRRALAGSSARPVRCRPRSPRPAPPRRRLGRELRFRADEEDSDG